MNSGKDNLRIYEEVLLLVLRDKEGSVHFGINYQFALAGSIIAELLLNKKIVIEQDRKKKYIKLVDGEPTDDPVMNDVLAKLASAKRRAQVAEWVRRFANMPGLKHRIAESLCKKRILKMEEDKVLFIFRRKLYPEVDPRPEKRMLDRMYRAIFTDKQDIDPHTLILVAISESTGLLKVNFDKKKLRKRKGRIKEIVKGNMVGAATREAVEAMQAAVMVATIIPAVTVVATAGH